MDLPAHVLWTYALGKLVTPQYIGGSPEFVFVSLLSAALPDLVESGPFVIYLAVHRKKFYLKKLKNVIALALSTARDRQTDYQVNFPWAAKLSFYTHSFLVYGILTVFLGLLSKELSPAFAIGYGLHLVIDVFLHKDLFSSRPLFPISNFFVRGCVNWYKVKDFTKYNYLLLAAVYLAVLLTKH